MAEKSTEQLRYGAIAMQLKCVGVHNYKERDASRAQILTNVKRAADFAIASAHFMKFFNGIQCRLVLLPEFVLTGFPMGDSIPLWKEKACLAPDGPEFDILSKAAQDANIYIAGNAYEDDPNFPELYFQTCFIIAPNGDIILRYRRLTSTFEPTPYDVWDKYLDIYGLDGVFPVAKTEIGDLCMVASEEIQWPEMTRCHVMRGAEILLHPTSETGTPRAHGRDLCKQTRAVENMMYVLSANTSSLEDIPLPAYSCSGMSKVIDFLGNIMTEAGHGGESHAARATIDLGALREARRNACMINFLSRQPFEAYAESYANTTFLPPNDLMEDGQVKAPPGREFFEQRQNRTIERLSDLGLI